jgi:hypothetical protein
MAWAISPPLMLLERWMVQTAGPDTAASDRSEGQMSPSEKLNSRSRVSWSHGTFGEALKPRNCRSGGYAAGVAARPSSAVGGEA